MEIHLDRRLSEKRIFPAIDMNKSGTRREEDLLTSKEYEGVLSMRRALSSGNNAEATDFLISSMQRTKSNEEFVEFIRKQTFR